MRIAFCSFRLGDADGVSIETEKWRAAATSLGHETYRVAGRIPPDSFEADDIVVPRLAYDADAGHVGTESTGRRPPDEDELAAAFEGADVVVVENMFGLPLNVGATRVLADVSKGRNVVGHHHDLPSQRVQWRSIDPRTSALFPPDLPSLHHVVINDLSRRELASRGVAASVIRNTFDPDPVPGPRAEELRGLLDAGADTLVALQPTRAIPRKGVGLSIEWAERLSRRSGRDVVLCITGPCEDGYADEFSLLRRAASIRVTHMADSFHGPGSFTMADAYTACDVVVFPSEWEGFGNPVMESVAYGRPCVVTPYPVLLELMTLGFRFLLLDGDVDFSITAFLHGDDTDMAGNRLILARQLSPETLRDRLRSILDRFP